MSPPRPYSLGLRLSWAFAAQTLLGLGAVGLGIYLVMMLNLSERAAQELSRKSRLVRHLVTEAEQTGNLPGMRHKLDELLLAHDDLTVALLDAGGNVIYRSSRPSDEAAPQSRDIALDLPSARVDSGIRLLRLTLDRSADRELLDRLALALVLASVAGAAVVSAAGFVLVRRSLGPLRGLARQTQALRAGRLGQRLRMDRAVRELQPWVDEFNDLLGRLDEAYRRLESFSADVAHELRTPLATLIGQTEVELSRSRGTDDLRDTLGSNLEELHRLTSIVNDMLFLARADNGARAAGSPPASLAPQAAKVIAFHESALAERGLCARIQGDAWAAFDAGLVRRALSNLVGNAVRHADPGSEVVVRIDRRGAGAALAVTNHGPAVPPDALAHLFERFFRVRNAHPAVFDGSQSHHGLGLAIVKAIARMHGGDVHAHSSDGITSIGFTLASPPAASGHDTFVECAA